jgi:hypothetical protein
MGARLLARFEPDARHVFSGQPFVAARMQSDNSRTLRANQIFGRDPDRPTVARGLTDDLVRRMDVLRRILDCFHVLAPFECTDRRRAQAQQSTASTRSVQAKCV